MGAIRDGRFGLAVAVLLLVAACGDDDGGGGGPAAYDFSAFEAEIEAFMAEREEIDGVGAILVHRDDGVIFQRSFGAFTDGRISLIASASKMISAGVLMRLVDQGLLDLDEPIVDAVAWGDDNPAITPAQLVSNSSGLVSLLDDPAYVPYICQYFAGGTLQDCARAIFTTDRDDDDIIEPDTRFKYGGGQWHVAGGVAEIVSGKSWAELIRDTYTIPCGLEVLEYNNHFTQKVSEEGASPFSYPPGFDGDPANLLPSDNPNIEGGAYTTVGDYGQLLLMHLRGGMCGDNRVLSEESVRRMHANRIGEVYGGTTGGEFRGYGLGWWTIGEDAQLITDPGAYGAFPWIDQQREYAGYLVIEATSVLGGELFRRTYDIVNEAIDEARVSP